jgi:predicted RNA-binding Zn-ribbon protein involved in translation (DUF1610 family)
MADLISLLCPSCGGKLQVSPKASTMTCQHCGNEHLVRHEAGAITLEAYARCPQCGRNDKSEKVTAVIASQSQEISGMEQKNEVVIDGQGRQQVVARSFPFTRKQVSILGQQLAPPEQPIIDPNLQSQGFPPPRLATSTWGLLVILGGVALLIVTFIIGLMMLGGILMLFNSAGDLTQETVVYGLLGLVGGGISFLGGIALIVLGIFLVRRSVKKKRFQKEEIQRQLQEEADRSERIQSAWRNALDRWNQLYYCGRDDCVFIPGENSSAPLSKMKEYLFK